MTEEQRADLPALYDALSAGDLSILHAALQELAPPREERPVMLTTTPGSNNDLFWSAMVGLGWMSPAEPLDVPVKTRVFVIHPEGKEPIRDFLAKRSHSAAMTKIVNDLRTAVPPWLMQAVESVDGTPADLAIMLAGIVESTMRRAIKRHLHDEFLKEVARVAQEMRSL